MKKYFFILLLLPCWCWGQKKSWWDDSLRVWRVEDHLYIFDTEKNTYVPIKDSVPIVKHDTIPKVTQGVGLTIQGVVHDSTSAYFKTREWEDAAKATRLQDFVITAKVIMLVCDTSRWTGKEYIPIFSGIYNERGVADFSNSKMVGIDSSNTTVEDYKQNLYWQFGYKVTNYTSSPYYLNDSKERLPKNIIVWDYKEIKP